MVWVRERWEQSESPNVGPAKCWDRLDRPSEGKGISPMMRLDWWLRWWSWPPNMGDTATDGSRPCYVGKGWKVNHKRVERLWRQEGLKVPSRQPKRRRLWLNDGSCVRLRAAHKNHVWSYDFVHERTHDGRAFRLLPLLDEYTRECLAIDVKRQMNHQDVLDRLAELFVDRGVPEYIRSDNGSEFTAQAVRDWLKAVGVRTLYIEPGSPWENGYVESFNGKLRDEFLNVEIFDTLWEAKVLV